MSPQPPPSRGVRLWPFPGVEVVVIAVVLTFLVFFLVLRELFLTGGMDERTEVLRDAQYRLERACVALEERRAQGGVCAPSLQHCIESRGRCAREVSIRPQAFQGGNQIEHKLLLFGAVVRPRASSMRRLAPARAAARGFPHPARERCTAGRPAWNPCHILPQGARPVAAVRSAAAKWPASPPCRGSPRAPGRSRVRVPRPGASCVGRRSRIAPASDRRPPRSARE